MADEDNRTGGPTRRQFLRALGAAVGGVAISGAGAAGFGAQMPPGQRSATAAVPSGYLFYQVLTTERLLPWPGNPGRTNPVADMTGVVLMAGNTPRLYMHVTLAASAIPAGVPTDPPPSALVLAMIDYISTSQRPTIADIKIVAYEGQSLDANNIVGAAPELLPVRVDRIGTGDTNVNGLYATTLTSQDLSESVAINSAPGVYLYDPATDRWTTMRGCRCASPRSTCCYAWVRTPGSPSTCLAAPSAGPRRADGDLGIVLSDGRFIALNC